MTRLHRAIAIYKFLGWLQHTLATLTSTLRPIVIIGKQSIRNSLRIIVRRGATKNSNYAPRRFWRNEFHYDVSILTRMASRAICHDCRKFASLMHPCSWMLRFHRHRLWCNIRVTMLLLGGVCPMDKTDLHVSCVQHVPIVSLPIHILR